MTLANSWVSLQCVGVSAEFKLSLEVEILGVLGVTCEGIFLASVTYPCFCRLCSVTVLTRVS